MNVDPSGVPARFRPLAKPLNRPIRLGVLISGGGTTLDNFLAQIRAGRLPAQVALVIASRADCKGVEKSRAAGLKCQVVERRNHQTVEAFSQVIFAALREAQVDLVTLAGFLALLQIPDDFQGRVMNIHPALIPAFCGPGYYGSKVHAAALARGAKISGCTVHFADNAYDHGPIILQRAVEVYDDDTPETLGKRVFGAECESYPEAIRLYAAGRLEIRGSRVHIVESA
jgi:phosphoribosylglycinamide formyltransferase 1